MPKRIPGSRQSGLGLTELMISVALGMSLVSTVLLGYLATYRSAIHTLSASRLNQDLGALMAVMAGELRRAGYSAASASANFPLDNAFNIANRTALQVFDSVADNIRQGAQGRGSCIVYAYDRNADGVVDAEELAGFRLRDGVVEMRIEGNSAAPGNCSTSGGSWAALSDPDFITVEVLDFDLAASQCFNSREPDALDNDADGSVDNSEEGDCYTLLPLPGSGDISVESRSLAITLSGRLRRDTFTSAQLQRTVRVRNDWLREW